ncbi:MAG: hypothetical protein R2685_10495 [Candidatus Nitrosocosmicus sp.]|nr:hypothetical protein [Candidatus Nitrosocosmicus sp.]
MTDINLKVTDEELNVIIDGLGSVILENTDNEEWIKNPGLANIAMRLRSQFKLIKMARGVKF